MSFQPLTTTHKFSPIINDLAGSALSASTSVHEWLKISIAMPTTLEQIQYGFDRDSRRTWQKRPLSTWQDQSYQYDALSQVSAAARGSLNLNATAISGIPSLEESWNYDPTGNWLGYHAAANGVTALEQQRVHDRGNRLTQIEDNPHNMILDRVGRMRQMAPDAEGDWDGKLELTWDAWSRITSVKNNGEVVGEYTYDGSHRRVTRDVEEETLHCYYNDAWRPVEERKDSETTASMSYLWGARHRDDLVRRDRAVGGSSLNETRYVLMDYFNPAAITDDEGEVSERYAFSTFGVRTVLNPDFTVRSSSECAFEFAFQGQFLDVESGLMNYGYRYYTPNLGRWPCKDPIEERGGINLYLMCLNSTPNRIDQLGLIATCVGKSDVGKTRVTGCEIKTTNGLTPKIDAAADGVYGAIGGQIGVGGGVGKFIGNALEGAVQQGTNSGGALLQAWGRPRKEICKEVRCGWFWLDTKYVWEKVNEKWVYIDELRIGLVMTGGQAVRDAFQKEIEDFINGPDCKQ